MAPFRSNVRFFDALTAFLTAFCLHMVLGMLWERGARHAQRKWSCYYVLTPSSPIFKRVEYPAEFRIPNSVFVSVFVFRV